MVEKTDKPFEVRLVESPADIRALAAVFSRVWADNETFLYPPEVLRAISFAGGYVAGAYKNGEPVAASFGFRGRHLGAHVLHSHATGVVPGSEHSGIGMALKEHQRKWAADNDLSAITWTFDPLIRRNGYFNLGKLGARAVGYFENFYGDLPDDINANDETDRCIATWPTSEPILVPPKRGFVVLDADGVTCAAPGEDLVRNIHTPNDILDLRANDAEEALRWRFAMRVAFDSAMSDGFIATSCTRDGIYTLERR